MDFIIRLMTYLELHERLNITVSEFASSTAQQREMAFARAGDGEDNVDFVDANLLAGRHVHLGAGFESVAKGEWSIWIENYILIKANKMDTSLLLEEQRNECNVTYIFLIFVA